MDTFGSVPSYFNWNYTMPSIGPNGQLTGRPDPYADQWDPSKGTDIRWSDDTWQHLDPHKDRYGNYDNPTIFMSDSLPGGHAAAFKDTDEYGHIGRVFRTDRNRAIGKILALVGGGALAANMGAGAAGGVGDVGSEGYGISQDFLAGGLPGAETAGTLTPITTSASYLPAVAGTSIPYIGGTAAEVAGTMGGSMAAFPALAGGVESTGTLGGLLGSTGGGEGLPALAGDVGMESGAATPGFFGKMGTLAKNYFTKPDGSYDWMKIGKAGLAGMSVLGGMGGRNQPSAPGQPAWMTQPMDILPFTRSQTAPMSKADYYSYGRSGGEHQFFNDNVLPRKAGGGGVSGPGSGRSDDIEARLSDGEYVMDAETVALLGDGSTDEGSRRLDEMRNNLRRHKGKKLAHGKFSLAAKKPESYLPALRKGGRVRKFAAGGAVSGGGAMKRLNALADQFQRALSEGNTDAADTLTKPLVALHPDSVKVGYEAFAKGGSVADAIRKLVSGLREKPKPQSRVINMMMTPTDRIPANTDFNKPVDMAAVDAQLRLMKPDSPAVRLYESELRRRRAKSTAALYEQADQE